MGILEHSACFLIIFKSDNVILLKISYTAFFFVFFDSSFVLFNSRSPVWLGLVGEAYTFEKCILEEI